MAASPTGRLRFRSQEWFDNAADIGMTALYLERYFNFGLTPEELKAGRPIVGIAQTGSELAPCNYIHTQIVGRVRDIPNWNELDWEWVLQSRAQYQPLECDKLVLDAVDPLADNLARVRDYLGVVR